MRHQSLTNFTNFTMEALARCKRLIACAIAIVAVFVSAALLVALSSVAFAASPSGAIFTTTPDGTIVNENVHYTDKRDVYLDGGPPPNAPASAAGLDAANYVFQITDPSGQFLLSTDPAKCRIVSVNAAGVIDSYVLPSTLGLGLTDTYGSPSSPCRILDDGTLTNPGVRGNSGKHDVNADADHYADAGAIVVQMMPYGTTPNPGGVYKAWMIPLSAYQAKVGGTTSALTAALNLIPLQIRGRAAQPCPDFCAAADPGFGPPRDNVKTDNFKVFKKQPQFEAPKLTVIKFHDADLNCTQNGSEERIEGWCVGITDPFATNQSCTDSNGEIVVAAVPSGTWTTVEEVKTGTAQTSSQLEQAPLTCIGTNSPDPSVTVIVAGTNGETHTVYYGNVGLGQITACKVFDRDGDGVPEAGDPPVPGWQITLTGKLLNDTDIDPVSQRTGADGCTTFTNLLPGNYILTEGLPLGWQHVGPLFVNVPITSTLQGGTPVGTSATPPAFANFCGPFPSLAFGTKGYWHNRNGLAEITQDDITYVNGLDPYDSETNYFGAGDEPFNGKFTDSTDVAACLAATDLAPAGSTLAEICQFLVDNNAQTNPPEQLAQQLLAFIFNARHRLGGVGGSIDISGCGGPGFVLVQDIIDAAIQAWQTGAVSSGPFAGKTANQMQQLLDCLNNSSSVLFIPGDPSGCQ